MVERVLNFPSDPDAYDLITEVFPNSLPFLSNSSTPRSGLEQALLCGKRDARRTENWWRSRLLIWTKPTLLWMKSGWCWVACFQSSPQPVLERSESDHKLQASKHYHILWFLCQGPRTVAGNGTLGRRCFLNCWTQAAFSASVGSLYDIMRYNFPNGLKDEDLIAAILKQVLQGLAYFHQCQNIHRFRSRPLANAGSGESWLGQHSVQSGKKLGKKVKNCPLRFLRCWLKNINSLDFVFESGLQGIS